MNEQIYSWWKKEHTQEIIEGCGVKTAKNKIYIYNNSNFVCIIITRTKKGTITNVITVKIHLNTSSKHCKNWCTSDMSPALMQTQL